MKHMCVNNNASQKNALFTCAGIIALGLLSFALSGCGGGILASHKVAIAGLTATHHGLFSSPDVNLKAKNYAAADFLAMQIKGRVQPHDHIMIEPLVEQDNAIVSSEFGHNVPEGVGLRLHDLGYAVILDEVASAPGNGRASYARKHDNYILTGVYAVKRKHVDVFLRLINADNDAIVGRFDYAMPLSPEIKKMAKTETQIFIVPKNGTTQNSSTDKNDANSAPLNYIENFIDKP